MTDPMTPAALPRNREADAWRAKYEDGRFALVVAVIVAFCLGGKAVFLLLDADMRAARAQVSAAEQRAERTEAALRGGGNVCVGDDVRVVVRDVGTASLSVGPCAASATGALCLYDRGQP